MYTIHVHALKSASANIVADDLSNAASDLETAGTQADLSYIKSHTAQFLTALESVLNGINGRLSTHYGTGSANTDSTDSDSAGSADSINSMADTGALKLTLAELKTALENFDAGEMNRTVDTLQKMISFCEVSQ